jgi:hypothetical protein
MSTYPTSLDSTLRGSNIEARNGRVMGNLLGLRIDGANQTPARAFDLLQLTKNTTRTLSPFVGPSSASSKSSSSSSPSSPSFTPLADLCFDRAALGPLVEMVERTLAVSLGTADSGMARVAGWEVRVWEGKIGGRVVSEGYIKGSKEVCERKCSPDGGARRDQM